MDCDGVFRWRVMSRSSRLLEKVLHLKLADTSS